MKIFGRKDDRLVDNFYLWCHSKFSKVIGSLERIKEVILIIPVIYKCVRWDHSSIYYILHHWLSRMEDVQRNNSHHLYASRYADQIKLCVNLLDRILKDDYHDNVYKEHIEKWGEPEFNFEKLENGSSYSKLRISRPNVKTKEDEEQERKEYRLLMNKVSYLENQDINMLFDTIKKRHRHWWT